ncbi:MAG: 16S rRNA (cytidine(1402)-2'-O)-methyltransferase [Prevotellaceae bacterium]|jgi:16S rRNA (cytidine1402-2'-O)-methyltransferase|nr:16S rRNA (cytidine(1402)-2'-O)-methyltransferase [Prevotellaceae bacterium]
MKLYIVPTPIGNLEDLTFRAVRILREADLILAEDTRKTAILLKKYEIDTRMTSNHKFNEHRKAEQLVSQIAQGKSAALVSDAGTPGISDPGFLLVRACIEEGVEVECLPGASALIPALINSGFPCDRFCFEGFLPQKKGRTKRISALKSEERTMIFYESPYRTLKCLEQFAEVFGGERRACVCRELSKIHEENARGTLNELVEKFREREPKGEIVIVVEGFKDATKANYQDENEWKNIE